ncbi:MAG TPA: FG-GAP-like repeat-containing protein [Bryobacteraceae bacterium]|nr:FG-GAP-like repeat-containing protein [Bryobacteraceae bacterium]
MIRTFLLCCALPLAAFAQTVSFSQPVQIASGNSANCANCIAVADFNGDGKPDIAVNTMAAPGQNGVLLGNGDGTFRPIVPLAQPANGSIAAGDFNGDGRVDLLFNGASSQIEFGNGDGTFGAPTAVAGCSTPLVGDFNRDGKSDLVCGMSVWLGNGDGTFRNAGSFAQHAMEDVQTVADFNGDGTPDILIRQLSNAFSVVLGRGDGTFGDEIVIQNYGQQPQRNRNVLTGDFNGDGRADLIGPSVSINFWGQTIDFVPGGGDGTFGAQVQTNLSADPLSTEMTLAGDFNRDGKLDFVAGSSLYAGNGDGTFRFPVFFGLTAIASADFDGDSAPDLVAYDVENGSEAIYVLRNDSPGEGFWTPGVSAATGTWPVAPGSIVTAYGVDLAPKTEVATNPAPTTLGGIRVHVRGQAIGSDTLAPLLYVSPTQINYVLNSSDPYAWVDIEWVGSAWTPRGLVAPIAPFAPGFFDVGYSATAGGYLTLYGTGFANATTAGSTCWVGGNGVTAMVTYAGRQPTIAGLDQVNMLLPASLAGAGVQPVTCTFGNGQGASGVSKTINVTVR